MAKAKSILIQLECSLCKRRNYITRKNPANKPEKLQLKKFCQKCRKHTLHKEVKISKAKK